MLLPFEVNCQIVLDSVTILNNARHIFIHNNMFLYVTNISYCVIQLTFLLKMWMFKWASYWFKGAPSVGQLLTEYRVTKLGSVFKMCRWEVFSHYLVVRGNIIVYVTFCWNRLSLFLHLQYKDFKKMFKSAPLSPVLRMVKIRLLGVYMNKVVNNMISWSQQQPQDYESSHSVLLLYLYCWTCFIVISTNHGTQAQLFTWTSYSNVTIQNFCFTVITTHIRKHTNI